jgi:carbamoylphosphate synthase large subunit
MPKNESIKSVELIGSGPIVIGQAMSLIIVVHRLHAAREEGVKVILTNKD